MNCLLDTHFLLWITIESPRVRDFPWLDRYAAWGVSPISFLEIKFLEEVGKLEVEIDAFTSAVMSDSRFVVDEVPLLNLVHRSLHLSWTRDPFDRMLAAHSAARRKPLCRVNRLILKHHEFLPTELDG